MSNIWNKIFITCLCLFVATLSMAQSKTNSPYSSLGLGDVLNQNYAWLNAMGNLSASARDPYHVNVLNPASLSALTATAFEFGVKVKYANLKSTNNQLDVWTGNLGYLSLGFPIINPISEALSHRESNLKWGMNFALLPYTLVGYNIETTEQREDIGLITTNFEGTGSTYKFMWGNGVKVNNLSFGANLGYIFGKQSRDQVVTFDSLNVSYNDIFHDDLSMNGFVWNVGVQYSYLLKRKGEKGGKQYKGDKIVIGLYGNSDMNIQSKRSQFYSRYNRFYNDTDSIRNVPITTFQAKLPAEFGVGLTYEKVNNLKVGVNYSHAMWSDYENDANPKQLDDSYQISVGAELIPEIGSYKSYLKKIRYRLGAFYSNDPRSDRFNKQLTSYGITLGLGLPIILTRGDISFIDVTFELGKFGSEKSIQESYVNMTFGFTLNDNKWFFKRKFN